MSHVTRTVFAAIPAPIALPVIAALLVVSVVARIKAKRNA